jgi:hypothetical protein
MFRVGDPDLGGVFLSSYIRIASDFFFNPSRPPKIYSKLRRKKVLNQGIVGKVD